MTRPGSPTRREALGLFGAALAAGPALAAAPAPRDRGIGGTGFAPTAGGGDDRGIGGTGFVGTIQRFGSIIVNDSRIAYPPTVSVRIDGQARKARDLRIGHVVRVVARQSRGALATAAIEVESEVVGPILSLSEDTIDVMGQTVWVRAIAREPWWRKGAWVAVSGLRRSDGLVVASLVEPRPAGSARISGLLERDADGFWIGGLRLVAAEEALLGQRVQAVGRLGRGGLSPATLRAQPTGPGQAAIARLSLETYLRAEGQSLRLASGQTIPGARFASLLAADTEVRAFIDSRIGPDGGLIVESLRIGNAGDGTGPGGLGPASDLGPGLGPGQGRGLGAGPVGGAGPGPGLGGVGPGGMGPGGMGPGGLGPGGVGPGGMGPGAGPGGSGAGLGGSGGQNGGGQGSGGTGSGSGASGESSGR